MRMIRRAAMLGSKRDLKEIIYMGMLDPLPAVTSNVASAVIGGKLLLAGGNQSTTLRNTVYVYDEALTRTTATVLSQARYEAVGAANDMYAFIMGGNSNFNSITASNVVDRYDAALTRVTATALSQARYNPCGGAIGVYTLCLGGGYTTSGTAYYSDVVDAYNATGQRSTPTKLSMARSVAAGANTPFHFICAGGNHSGATGGTATADAYSSTLTRTVIANLSVARYRFIGGSVGPYALIGGGQIQSGVTDVVDVYNDSLTLLTPLRLSTARRDGINISGDGFTMFAAGSSSVVVDVFDETLAIKSPQPLSVGKGRPGGGMVGNNIIIAGSSEVEYYKYQ